MKNYLIAIECFGPEAEELDPEHKAMLTLEFGRQALGESWAHIHQYIEKNGLAGEVSFLSRPAYTPFFIITCTEKVASQLHGANLPGVKGIFEATMPFEVPDWHKHLRPLAL